MAGPKNLIITGTPGVGKTTLIKECVYPYHDHIGGFMTEEMKEGPVRQGFLLKTFDGDSGILARKGMASKNKLNKYGVDLKVIENIGIPSMQRAASERQVIVVDEIGTMELLSQAFAEAVTQVLAGPKPLLATIRRKAEPFTSHIKKMSDTELIVLTRENFPKVKETVRAWIKEKTHP